MVPTLLYMNVEGVIDSLLSWRSFCLPRLPPKLQGNTPVERGFSSHLCNRASACPWSWHFISSSLLKKGLTVKPPSLSSRTQGHSASLTEASKRLCWIYQFSSKVEGKGSSTPWNLWSPVLTSSTTPLLLTQPSAGPLIKQHFGNLETHKLPYLTQIYQSINVYISITIKPSSIYTTCQKRQLIILILWEIYMPCRKHLGDPKSGRSSEKTAGHPVHHYNGIHLAKAKHVLI